MKTQIQHLWIDQQYKLAFILRTTTAPDGAETTHALSRKTGKWLKVTVTDPGRAVQEESIPGACWWPANELPGTEPKSNLIERYLHDGKFHQLVTMFQQNMESNFVTLQDLHDALELIASGVVASYARKHDDGARSIPHPDDDPNVR